MSVKGSTSDGRQAAQLLVLFRAIASRDRALTSRLLTASPLLARQAIEVGATRDAAKAYFLEEIRHYVYAGDTALHVAAAAYEAKLAGELVAAGANPSARNRRGAEPLHYAADGIPGSDAWAPERQYSVVELLIRAGADPNAKDSSGVAPLHRAVRTRCTAAVRALLANGADAIGKNKSGSTPLHLAVLNTGRGASGSIESRQEQEQVIRLLLDHGARASDKNAAGKSVKDCVQAEWLQVLLK
jgi:ankyrin repeat protein